MGIKDEQAVEGNVLLYEPALHYYYAIDGSVAKHKYLDRLDESLYDQYSKVLSMLNYMNNPKEGNADAVFDVDMFDRLPFRLQFLIAPMEQMGPWEHKLRRMVQQLDTREFDLMMQDMRPEQFRDTVAEYGAHRKKRAKHSA